MAKQRRAQPRPITRKVTRAIASPAIKRRKKSVESQKPARTLASGERSRPNPPPVRRTGYLEAVARYEQGLQALLRHEYGPAGEALRSVLADYPEEKELHERVRLYLNVCERQETPKEAAPRTAEERLYAATLALNAGAYDAAVRHLEAIRERDPENDHALYMLAVAYTLRGDTIQAAPLLQRAIELNRENRSLARQDPDLESLRRNEGIRALLDAVPPRPDRRRPVRGRQMR